MKDLSYTNIFGKYYSHEEALMDKVISHLMHIEMEENRVSEKSFSAVDEIRSRMAVVASENKSLAIDLYNSGKRVEFISESIWDLSHSRKEKNNDTNMIKRFNELYGGSDRETDRSEWQGAPEIPSEDSGSSDRSTRLFNLYRRYHKMDESEFVKIDDILMWVLEKGALDAFMDNLEKFPGSTKL